MSIGLSLALGGGIIYATHQYDGPFQPENVSGLYATIATTALGVYCVKMVIADLHYGTVYLLFTTAGDRIKFLLSRVIIITFVSSLFGIGCAALLYVNHILNQQVFSLSDIGASFFHYVLFGLFFTLFFLTISMHYQKTMNLLVLSLGTILVLPGILGIVLQIDSVPQLVKNFVFYLPLYSLPNDLPFLAMKGLEIIVVVLVSIVLFAYAYYRLPKTDY